MWTLSRDEPVRDTAKQYTDRFANLCYLMHVQLASVHFTSIVSLTLTLTLKISQIYPKVDLLNCFVLKVLIINITQINVKLFIKMNNKGQYPGNVPPPSKPEDFIFCKTVNSYGMKVNITI